MEKMLILSHIYSYHLSLIPLLILVWLYEYFTLFYFHNFCSLYFNYNLITSYTFILDRDRGKLKAKKIERERNRVRLAVPFHIFPPPGGLRSWGPEPRSWHIVRYCKVCHYPVLQFHNSLYRLNICPISELYIFFLMNFIFFSFKFISHWVGIIVKHVGEFLTCLPIFSVC